MFAKQIKCLPDKLIDLEEQKVSVKQIDYLPIVWSIGKCLPNRFIILPNKIIVWKIRKCLPNRFIILPNKIIVWKIGKVSAKLQKVFAKQKWMLFVCKWGDSEKGVIFDVWYQTI